jgi:hypothetical protein
MPFVSLSPAQKPSRRTARLSPRSGKDGREKAAERIMKLLDVNGGGHDGRFGGMWENGF